MWSPFTSTKTSHNDHPTDVGRHVLDAYALLCNAHRRGIQVPSDVVSTLHRPALPRKPARAKGPLETKCWNAYGLLSSIEPAERARRTYKLTFYGVLVTLLLGQFFYLGGASVRDNKTSEVAAHVAGGAVAGARPIYAYEPSFG